MAGAGASAPLDADRLASRLGIDAIAVADGPLTVAWLPDPEAPGAGRSWRRALEGMPAALGPAVALERAAQSLARARAAHALVLDGRSCPPISSSSPTSTWPPWSCTPATRRWRRTWRRRRSPRWTSCSRARRARLEATLRAWLDHPGQVSRMAGELHVHPQTVRYRLAQLRELFGARLDDPDARFELALALRAGQPT